MSPTVKKVVGDICRALLLVIALLTYTLTVEPVSFGIVVNTLLLLQVGHPPGAPLFQMIGAFFAMFAIDNQHIALMVNMTSVFSSAFTILFLFWSSSIILKKLVNKTNEQYQ
jgi:hypothetical protein